MLCSAVLCCLCCVLCCAELCCGVVCCVFVVCLGGGWLLFPHPPFHFTFVTNQGVWGEVGIVYMPT